MRLGKRGGWRISIKFEPRDCWVGLFWRTQVSPTWNRAIEELGFSPWFRYTELFVCVLPMLPIIIRLWWSVKQP